MAARRRAIKLKIVRTAYRPVCLTAKMNRIIPATMAITMLTGFANAALSAEPTPAANLKTVVLAGGCFWCIQPAFDKAPGVVKSTVGYCGGTEPNPTYELVGSEKTAYR